MAEHKVINQEHGAPPKPHILKDPRVVSEGNTVIRKREPVVAARSDARFYKRAKTDFLDFSCTLRAGNVS